MGTKELQETLSEMTIEELNEELKLVNDEIEKSSMFTESEYVEMFNEKPIKKCIGMWNYLALKWVKRHIEWELESRTDLIDNF